MRKNVIARIFFLLFFLKPIYVFADGQEPHFFINPYEKHFSQSLVIYGGITLLVLLICSIIAAVTINVHLKKKGLGFVFLHQVMSKEEDGIKANLLLADAARLIETSKIDNFPIVDQDNILVGVILKKDREKLLSESFRIRHCNVAIKNLVEKNFDYLYPHDTLQKAVTLMTERGCEWVPVVDEVKRIIGAVTHRDVIKFISGYLAG